MRWKRKVVRLAVGDFRKARWLQIVLLTVLGVLIAPAIISLVTGGPASLFLS
jgi:hypothetical protein